MLHDLMLRQRAAPYVTASVPVVLVTLILIWVDAFSPPVLPLAFSSTDHLLGFCLILILVPGWALVAWGLGLRHSERQVRIIESLLPDRNFEPTTLQIPWGWLTTGVVAGAAYGILLNLPIVSIDELHDPDALLLTLIAMMVLTWICVFAVLTHRLWIAEQFRDLGRRVVVDPWRRESLEPFARNGIADVIFVASGLVLAVVQSIDATFRWQNYLWAFLVALPAGLFLLFRPMTSVHRRLVELRAAELAELDRLIEAAPRDLDPDAVSTFERLLQRRDRVRERPTWPLNVSMVSRLVFYGVIPPAAWIAAALVEQLVESLISG